MKGERKQSNLGRLKQVRIAINGEIKVVGEIEENRIVLEEFANYVHVERSSILVKDSYFDQKMKVPNVCRYLLERKDNQFFLTSHDLLLENNGEAYLLNSNYRDLVIEKDDDKRCIFLVVESPHRFEYKYDGDVICPIAPAQGSTGRLIEKELASIVNRSALLRNSLKHDVYRVLIVNPVPFQTSLFALHRRPLRNGYKLLRDNVWKELWQNNILKSEFLDLVNRTRPELILNCCTRALSDFVSLELDEAGTVFYVLNHPSSWFKKDEECNVKIFENAKLS